MSSTCFTCGTNLGWHHEPLQMPPEDPRLVDVAHLRVAARSLAFHVELAQHTIRPTPFNDQRKAALEAIRASLKASGETL